MRTQLARLRIDPSKQGRLQQLARQWADDVGKGLDGCEALGLSFADDGSGLVTIRMDFSDQAALDRFSSDEGTMKVVEELKQLADGSLDYSEADSTEHKLTA